MTYLFIHQVRAEIEDVYYEAGEVTSAKSTTFHIHPTVMFHNLLPYNINVMLEVCCIRDLILKPYSIIIFIIIIIKIKNNTPMFGHSHHYMTL